MNKMASSSILSEPIHFKFSFTFAYANVCSITVSNDLGCRIDHLKDLLIVSNNCDLFLCSETHLDESIDNDVIAIPNYRIIRRDRNRHGGGTAMFIKECLNFNRKLDFEDPSIELIWIEILFDNNHKSLFGVCYRPPGQNATEVNMFLTCLESSFDRIHALNRYYDSIVLTGDFNDVCTAWEGSHYKSELKDNLLSLSRSLLLTQMVKESTRFGNLLDLVFTNVSEMFTSAVQVLDPIHELDHCPILCMLSSSSLVSEVDRSHSHCYRHVFHYDNGDFVKLKNMICQNTVA